MYKDKIKNHFVSLRNSKYIILYQISKKLIVMNKKHTYHVKNDALHYYGRNIWLYINAAEIDFMDLDRNFSRG